MLTLFKRGETKRFLRKASSNDLATFDEGNVHQVVSTFSIARDAEWVCRLFVIDMKDEDEEGIGTFIHVEHLSPAFEGEELEYLGTFDLQEGNSVICSFRVLVGERTIATGQTGQKILKKEKINNLFNNLRGKRE